MADDFECTYLRCVFHVQTDAEAFIVIAHVHHSHGFGGMVGQTFQVESPHGFLLYAVILGYYLIILKCLVYGLFYVAYLLFGGAGG